MSRIFIFALLILSLCSTSFAADFILKSTSFTNNQAIPAAYTCEGKNRTPELSWSGVPMKTQSFALIVSDPDAPTGTWYHWVVFNLPVAMNEIQEGLILLLTGIPGKNSFGGIQYNGPCPPSGTHHYIFTLYALDSSLPLATGAEAQTVLSAMVGHILGQATLQGTYTKVAN